MKKIILITFLLSKVCFAITVDLFECEFNFTTIKGLSYQTKTTLAAARTQITSPNTHYIQTRGNFVWSQEIPFENGFFKILINYNYIHAIKKDFSAARVYRCSDVKIETPNNGVSDFSCPEATLNPFEPGETPWAVAKIENQIASFPVRNWKFSSQLPEGNFFYSCARIKTLN